MSARWYEIKIVPNDRPNDDGRWIKRRMTRPPTFDDIFEDGTHTVALREVTVAPVDQPPTQDWYVRYGMIQGRYS